MKTVALLLTFATTPWLVAAEESASEATPERIGHPFSWPFVGWEAMKPYGGTTKASRTELATETKPEFKAIYEAGLDKKERDRRAILALAGDHRVSFDFIETASSADNYQPRPPYFSWATERAFVIEESADFISLQHVLVMEFVEEDGTVSDPFVMKHWRQDWKFQDRNLVEFQGDRNWAKRELPEQKGTWTQAVYQVDDSPRYETVGRWTHFGGLSIFRSQNFWRPLPRREFSVRDDYNVLGGVHEITVTPTGWLHSQLNQKLLVTDGRVQKRLATELGAVRYERITTPSLAKAEDYWTKTGDFWKAVRTTWNAVEASDAPFSLQKKVDGQSMFMSLFSLAESEDQKTAKVEAMAVIGSFLAE